MEIVFMGTPEFSVGVLEKILQAHKVIAVFTQPDRKRGRGGKLIPSPVKKVALQHRVKVYTPDSFDREHIDVLKKADVSLVVAYGKILPSEVLYAPKYGSVNIHASLLPKYRGASPMDEAILQGDPVTGITYMAMNEKMDEGDILLQKDVNIEGMYIDQVHDTLAKLSADTVLPFLEDLEEYLEKAVPQNHSQATYVGKRAKEDSLIDFHGNTEDVLRQIRAFSPYPGATTFLEGKRLKVHKAQIDEEIEGIPGSVVKTDKRGIYVKTLDGVILITELQPEGKKTMNAGSFLLGNPVEIGVKLGGNHVLL